MFSFLSRTKNDIYARLKSIHVSEMGSWLFYILSLYLYISLYLSAYKTAHKHMKMMPKKTSN